MLCQPTLLLFCQQTRLLLLAQPFLFGPQTPGFKLLRSELFCSLAESFSLNLKQRCLFCETTHFFFSPSTRSQFGFDAGIVRGFLERRVYFKLLSFFFRRFDTSTRFHARLHFPVRTQLRFFFCLFSQRFCFLALALNPGKILAKKFFLSEESRFFLIQLAVNRVCLD